MANPGYSETPFNCSSKKALIIFETALRALKEVIVTLWKSLSTLYRPILTPPQNTSQRITHNEVTITVEVEQLIGDSSTKQCALDSAPVWSLYYIYRIRSDPRHPQQRFHKPLNINAPSLVLLSRNRDSTPCTDPASYRPISNLSFISKFVRNNCPIDRLR